MSTAPKHIIKVFNLLKPHQAPPSAWDTIYTWLVTKAKLILIVAEVFVAITFVAKVLVDTQSKVLVERVQQLDEQMKFSYTELEAQARDVQLRSKAYVNTWDGSSNYSPLLQEINGYLVGSPSEISITFNDQSVSVVGFDSRSAVASLETSMKSSSSFTQVELFEITSGGTDLEKGTGVFGIRAEFDEQYITRTVDAQSTN